MSVSDVTRSGTAGEQAALPPFIRETVQNSLEGTAIGLVAGTVMGLSPA